jgi:DNA primase
MNSAQAERKNEMAKVSPGSIKYMIHASFKAEGPVEKPDVIGAIFGQTEGLLGDELEMRELQKEGKIGRIEVELQVVDGKAVGSIQVPSALDKSETTLIAAALETIERIGPTEGKIIIDKIEDVRGSKRDYILERAKKLMDVIEGNSTNFDELSKSVTEGSRVAKIQEYGEEKLPAGDISDSEIIVVEGRADVINLLKNRVNNVIGMNGTKLPAEIAKLGEEKEITLFIDGDRGGKLIAQNVINNAKIAYVAVAPDGKEVEELTGKEVLVALRKKVTVKDFLKGNGKSAVVDEETQEPEKSIEEGKVLVREIYEQIKGGKIAALVDASGDIIRKVQTKEVSKNIAYSKKAVYAVVIDGMALSTIIKNCDEFGVKILAATNFAAVKPEKVELVSL